MMMMAGFGALAAALPAPTAWADPSRPAAPLVDQGVIGALRTAHRNRDPGRGLVVGPGDHID